MTDNGGGSWTRGEGILHWVLSVYIEVGWGHYSKNITLYSSGLTDATHGGSALRAGATGGTLNIPKAIGNGASYGKGRSCVDATDTAGSAPPWPDSGAAPTGLQCWPGVVFNSQPTLFSAIVYAAPLVCSATSVTLDETDIGDTSKSDWSITAPSTVPMTLAW